MGGSEVHLRMARKWGSRPGVPGAERPDAGEFFKKFEKAMKNLRFFKKFSRKFRDFFKIL